MYNDNNLNGSGIYSQDAIIGPFPESDNISKVLVHQIDEIRAIRGEDGETYYNAKDLTVAMKQVAFSMTIPTLSVLSFIRRMTIELITARRV